MSTARTSGALGGGKRAADLLELELHMFVSAHVGTGPGPNPGPLQGQQVILTTGRFSRLSHKRFIRLFVFCVYCFQSAKFLKSNDLKSERMDSKV